MRSVSRAALAVAEVPERSGLGLDLGSVAVAVAGACSGADYSGCYCCFRYHHCTEVVTNAVVVCDHRLLLIFLLHRPHRRGVDAFVAGVAIAHSAHSDSVAALFAAAVDALLADNVRLNHPAAAGVVVVVAAAAVAAGVVRVFSVDDYGVDAVDVGPSTILTVGASVAHAVHAALPSADHVTQ